MGPEVDMLRAARGGDEDAFRALVEPHRRGVLAHCYRMCGSLQEAEELVQEAMLRAWRGLSGFEERASVKTWLYRIATHATLDALKSTKRRTLPPAEGEPTGPDTTAEPVVEPIWLEPFPDTLLPDEQLDQRRTVGFAFLQVLQKLPPSQRAALLLKEVVGSSAAEVADLLDTSSSAVNSMLQRARATLGDAEPPAPANDTELAVVRSYVEAFESANVDALVTLLRDDARMSMPPVPSWYQGPRRSAGGYVPTCSRPTPRGATAACPPAPTARRRWRCTRWAMRVFTCCSACTCSTCRLAASPRSWPSWIRGCCGSSRCRPPWRPERGAADPDRLALT
ncbi:MAG: RNA polymerase subunit sigma-70 [Polyangiaceae bacterium]